MHPPTTPHLANWSCQILSENVKIHQYKVLSDVSILIKTTYMECHGQHKTTTIQALAWSTLEFLVLWNSTPERTGVLERGLTAALILLRAKLSSS